MAAKSSKVPRAIPRESPATAPEGAEEPDKCPFCGKPADVEVAVGILKHKLCARCARIGYKAIKLAGVLFGGD